MARNAGEEDRAGFRSDEYLVSINDTLGIKISETDVTAAGPYMSASVSVLILSASTATATIGAAQHLVLADATAAEFGLTLPAVATVIGRSYTVKKIDGGANAILVSGSSAAATIDGFAFKSLDSENESITVMSDGSMYHVTGFFSAALGV